MNYATLFIVFILVILYGVNVAETVALRNDIGEVKLLVEDKYAQSRVENLKDIAGIYRVMLVKAELDNVNTIDTLTLASNSVEMASSSLDMLHSIFKTLE